MYKTTLWKQNRRYRMRQKRKETIWLILMVIAIALGIIGFYYGLTDALYGHDRSGRVDIRRRDT